MRIKGVFYLFFLGLLVCCEQPYVGVETDEEVAEEVSTNVFLSVRPLPCERLNIAVFQGDTKVKTASMTGHPLCGQLALSLPCGSYQIVGVAHSSLSNATFSSLNKITFKNNLVSETYLSSANVSVDSTFLYRTLSFECVTAKIMVSYLDALPLDASLLKFYYTGGSSTLSAAAAFGSVNSRQTVKLALSSSQEYVLYTFPHEETDSVKLTLSVLASDESVLKTFELDDIPVRQCHLTRVRICGGMASCEAPVEEISSTWGDGFDYPF